MSFILISITQLALMSVLHTTIGIDDNLAITCIIVFFMFTDALAIQRDSKLNGLTIQIFCALLFRVALIYLDQFGKDIIILPNSGTDSEGFYRSCLLLANGVVINRGAFVSLMGTLMRYVGTSRIFGQFIVVIFSMVSVIFTAYTLSEIGVKREIQSITMWVIALLPNFAILGSIFLRESLVTMWVAISCYLFARWMKGRNTINIILAVSAVFTGALFHSGVTGILAGYVVAMLLYDNKNNTIHIGLGRLFLVILFILAFTYVYNNYADVFFGKMQNIESTEDIANTYTPAGTSYAVYVGNSNSLAQMLRYTPIRIIYFLFSPLPWQWRGFQDIIAFMFSSLFYIWTIFKTVTVFRSQQEQDRKRILIWLIIVFAVTFVFAWGVSNSGTAARHRDKLVPMFAVLFAYAVQRQGDIYSTQPTSKYIKESSND